MKDLFFHILRFRICRKIMGIGNGEPVRETVILLIGRVSLIFNRCRVSWQEDKVSEADAARL